MSFAVDNIYVPILYEFYIQCIYSIPISYVMYIFSIFLTETPPHIGTRKTGAPNQEYSLERRVE